MATILPFRPYRFSAKAGPLQDLVTQPYDKITPAMQERYLARHPHNFVRIILGPQPPGDSATDNVYTRAAGHLRHWIEQGILERDDEPAFYPYFQTFEHPDTGERFTRKGLIGLGPVEDYAAGVVYRHEQTLTGPKKDRLELLRHTRAHLEQLFLLYEDPLGMVDALLDEAAVATPLAALTDEYGAAHSLWRMSGRERTDAVSRLMEGKRLLIADGHHRYETALNYRNQNAEWAPARRVMMTLVNMNSPGLKILATHRLVGGLANAGGELLEQVRRSFQVDALDSTSSLRERWAKAAPGKVRIGMMLAGDESLYALETVRGPGELDVGVLHDVLIGRILGISEQAVRDEKHLRYTRGLDAAVAEVQSGAAQIVFLLEPATIEQVARVSFSGGVMPQKSTDFYPKLLSGLTIYAMDT